VLLPIDEDYWQNQLKNEAQFFLSSGKSFSKLEICLELLKKIETEVLRGEETKKKFVKVL